MKDFKSYSQSGANGGQNAGGTSGRQNAGGTGGGTSGGQNAGNAKGAGGNSEDNVKQTVNMATMLAKAFNGKSETQIFQTIIAQAEQGKRDGTLTNADLDNFYNALSPLLDGFKRQRLKAIIQKLKAI